MKLSVFNPSHDLALANNNENFLPPLSVRQMEKDLMLLPRCYEAAAADSLLCGLGELSGVNPEDASVVDVWGWNPQIRKRLSDCGISRSLLPDDAALESIRRFSSRSQAVACLRLLRSSGCEWMCGESYYFSSVEDARLKIESLPQSIVKAPLSGSGRGLRFASGVFAPPLSGWVKNVVDKQGGVVVEPRYDKVMDFALEFESDGKGEVRYLGLSLFSSTLQGIYDGNIVGSEATNLMKLAQYVSIDKLSDLKQLLQKWLSDALGKSYTGVLGVDCMVVSSGAQGSVLIHPCVEINLRKTMGWVALQLSGLVSYGSTGLFRIEYSPSSGFSKDDYLYQLSHDGHLLSGTMPLTPIAPTTRYLATLKIL